MRERALLAGGRLSVTAGDGRPTRVAAILPLPARD
jgi:signal transduction histidine kinase